jgi:hypothetical protein
MFYDTETGFFGIETGFMVLRQVLWHEDMFYDTERLSWHGDILYENFGFIL